MNSAMASLLPKQLRIDGAVGLNVFAEREPHRADVALLAGHSQGCRGRTQ